MADHAPPYPLTTGQRRRLEITLMRLSQEAHDMAGLVSREAPDGAAAGAILAELEAVRAGAESLARDLGLSLTREPVSWKRRVHAWAALSWSDVLDSGPGPLRGYGAVDPRTAEVLGPRIEALAHRLMRVSARARPDHEDEELPPTP